MADLLLQAAAMQQLQMQQLMAAGLMGPLPGGLGGLGMSPENVLGGLPAASSGATGPGQNLMILYVTELLYTCVTHQCSNLSKMSTQCGFNTSKGSKPQALEELRVLLCRLHHHLPFEVGKVAARSCERLRLLAE